jgi:hypothetical protein
MFKIELSFGHKTATGELLSADRVIAAEHHALEVFARLFQGAQLYHGTGSFLHTDGTMVIEPSSTIWSYAETVEGRYDPLYALGRELIAALDQTSVLLCTLALDWMVSLHSLNARRTTLLAYLQTVLLVYWRRWWWFVFMLPATAPALFCRSLQKGAIP